MKDMFETPVYHTMCHRFDTRYAVKLDMPEELRVLPGDVSAYQFPAKNPPFIQVKWEVDDDHLAFDYGAKKIGVAYSRRNMRGEDVETFSADSLMLSSERAPMYRFTKGCIIDFQFQDYVGNVRPEKKPSVCQEYFWGRAVLEEANLSYTVPMKRNEIRGYSDKSSRTWIYDTDLNKKGVSWNLEKDGTVLTGATTSFTTLQRPSGLVAEERFEQYVPGTVLAGQGSATDGWTSAWLPPGGTASAVVTEGHLTRDIMGESPLESAQL